MTPGIYEYFIGMSGMMIFFFLHNNFFGSLSFFLNYLLVILMQEVQLRDTPTPFCRCSLFIGVAEIV